MNPAPAPSQPSYPPSLSPAPAPDLDTLKLLAAFHYAFGGLLILSGIACGLMLAFVGSFFASGPGGLWAHSTDNGITALFSSLGAIVVTICLVKGGLVLWVARSLAARRRFALCFVVGCVELLVAPIGTALGLFTLITINRESTRALFID